MVLSAVRVDFVPFKAFGTAQPLPAYTPTVVTLLPFSPLLAGLPFSPGIPAMPSFPFLPGSPLNPLDPVAPG